MAGAAAESPRVWMLVAQIFGRRILRRIRLAPAFFWRHVGRTPERILVAPPDLRLADREVATAIYGGRYAFAGHFVDTGGASPFAVQVHHRGWRKSVHSFRWLRHMREAGNELAAANARALVADWIATHGRRASGIAWEPDVLSRRIIAWLQHSTIVLHNCEYQFYRSFLKSLAFQIRLLRSVTAAMPNGEERLRARIALAFAALSLPTTPANRKAAARNLALELERQILPDGGHVSRNPRAVLELLADLLPLRQTYAGQGITPPQALIDAVERMLPALRFFRHEDGGLAHFNGMGATIADRVAAILRHDDTVGAPLLDARHSGYQRMSAGGTTVIADTGPPPPLELSADSHAGCLSFEMSSGRQQFIVNSGIDSYGPDDYRSLARLTAAHSTAVVNDSSSCRFNAASTAGQILGTTLVAGPKRVDCKRLDDEDRQIFRATHDGYLSRFGLLHVREMALSRDGGLIEGRDRICRPGGKPPKPGTRSHVALRFHLHPEIRLYRDDQERLVLGGQGPEMWIFTCSHDDFHIEESLFFAGIGGPQKSAQIVVVFSASEVPAVTWQFSRVHMERETKPAPMDAELASSNST